MGPRRMVSTTPEAYHRPGCIAGRPELLGHGRCAHKWALLRPPSVGSQVRRLPHADRSTWRYATGPGPGRRPTTLPRGLRAPKPVHRVVPLRGATGHAAPRPFRHLSDRTPHRRPTTSSATGSSSGASSSTGASGDSTDVTSPRTLCVIPGPMPSLDSIRQLIETSRGLAQKKLQESEAAGLPGRLLSAAPPPQRRRAPPIKSIRKYINRLITSRASPSPMYAASESFGP